MCAVRRPTPEAALRLEIPLQQLTAPFKWNDLFTAAGPNAIEIGTGNGMFLAREAGLEPGMNFIGIEYEKPFHWKMAKRCARAGLSNVRTTTCDAFEFLGYWVPPHSVCRLYCHFSDPWPKRRHRQRRLFGPLMPPLLERILVPGGEVRFKTDIGYYFNLAVTAFREHGRWSFVQAGPLPPPDSARGEVWSNYERKARAEGRSVWGFRAKRSTEPPGLPL